MSAKPIFRIGLGLIHCHTLCLGLQTSHCTAAALLAPVIQLGNILELEHAGRKESDESVTWRAAG